MTPGRPRPRIVCHMTMSVDGRQLPERWSDPAEGVDGDRLEGGMVWLRYRVEPAASTNGAAAPLSVPRHHG